MKNLLRVLLLGCFAAVVFMPSGVVYEWVIWVLLILMFALVAAYYWALYGVTDDQAAKALGEGEEIRYSSFSGIVTGYGKAVDLVRGRLLITNKNLHFIKKEDKGFEILETIPITSLVEYSTGKLLSYRKGITFKLNDDREFRFTISRIEVREAQIKAALGW